jgi:hypothetical protein
VSCTFAASRFTHPAFVALAYIRRRHHRRRRRPHRRHERGTYRRRSIVPHYCERLMRQAPTRRAFVAGRARTPGHHRSHEAVTTCDVPLRNHGHAVRCPSAQPLGPKALCARARETNAKECSPTHSPGRRGSRPSDCHGARDVPVGPCPASRVLQRSRCGRAWLVPRPAGAPSTAQAGVCGGALGRLGPS